MTRSPPLSRLHEAVGTVDGLLRQLHDATQRAIVALRDADSSALESALDVRGALLPSSGAAFEELTLARGLVEPLHPEAVRVALRGTVDAADRLRELEGSLHVALSAVRDQARTELRDLDQVDARTSRYRPIGQAHGGTIDLKS